MTGVPVLWHSSPKDCLCKHSQPTYHCTIHCASKELMGLMFALVSFPTKGFLCHSIAHLKTALASKSASRLMQHFHRAARNSIRCAVQIPPVSSLNEASLRCCTAHLTVGHCTHVMLSRFPGLVLQAEKAEPVNVIEWADGSMSLGWLAFPAGYAR